MTKAKHFSEVKNFTDIPNIGLAMEGDFIFNKLPRQLAASVTTPNNL